MRVLDNTGTFEIGRAGEKVWAPDSHAVAWLKQGEQRTTLMITEIAGGAPRAIDVDPGGDVSLVWSTDNVRLAYVVSTSGEPPSPPHLYVVDTVTGERVEAGQDLALEGRCRSGPTMVVACRPRDAWRCRGIDTGLQHGGSAVQHPRPRHRNGKDQFPRRRASDLRLGVVNG